MKKTIIFLGIMFITLISQGAEQAPSLPNDPQKWLDQKPVSWNQLQGKVVLLNVWTFG